MQSSLKQIWQLMQFIIWQNLTSTLRLRYIYVLNNFNNIM